MFHLACAFKAGLADAKAPIVLARLAIQTCPLCGQTIQATHKVWWPRRRPTANKAESFKWHWRGPSPMHARAELARLWHTAQHEARNPFTREER